MKAQMAFAQHRAAVQGCRRQLVASLITALLLLSGCATQPPAPSEAHLKVTPQAPSSTIPQPVMDVPLPPSPDAEQEDEVFSVVVNDVPLKALLFALSRDSGRNIDIASDIPGNITINAIDQTLPQILERIERQAPIRYQILDDRIVVVRDSPFLQHYEINYVNMQRSVQSKVSIKTEVSSTGSGGVGDTGSSGGSGGNLSSTEISNVSDNQFWETLLDNVKAILRGGDSTGKKGESQAGAMQAEDEFSVIANRESGVLSVKATAKQHAQIQAFIDKIINSALRQVLIEATIVEVNLNDDYQAGVDWSKIAIGGGFSFAQSMLGGNLANAPSFSMSYASTPSGDNLLATVKLLSQFGDSKVLSSPKLMVLNNQTALLKVVDNRVYFTTTVTTDTTQGVSTSTIETEVHTVPVGFVMSVTPQISSDKMVTLNARPTISRIVGFVRDPNPTLADAGVESLIPEVQVREIESMLKIASGDIGVIGGLMQDTVNHSTSGLPGVARVELLGDLFSYKENSFRKTELVIFLRPVVIHTASVTADLDDFGRYLSALPAAEAGAK